MGFLERLNIQKDCEQLQLLIQQSDVIFIVMDSREVGLKAFFLAKLTDKLMNLGAMVTDTFIFYV